MALRPDQVSASLGKLYKPSIPVKYASMIDNFSPNIWINSGAIDIYVSNSATQPEYISAMTLSDTSVSAIQEFEILPFPTYISFVQKTGTTTELVCTMMELEELGDIT